MLSDSKLSDKDVVTPPKDRFGWLRNEKITDMGIKIEIKLHITDPCLTAKEIDSTIRLLSTAEEKIKGLIYHQQHSDVKNGAMSKKLCTEKRDLTDKLLKEIFFKAEKPNQIQDLLNTLNSIKKDIPFYSVSRGVTIFSNTDSSRWKKIIEFANECRVNLNKQNACSNLHMKNENAAPTPTYKKIN